MSDQCESWELKLEKKIKARKKKRKPVMKVSGKSVLKLKKIIQQKNSLKK